MANTKVTSRVLANDAVLTANIADDQVTTAKIADDQITSALVADDIALGGNPTTTTQSAGNNTTRIATTAFVSTAVSNLVDSSPSALNTLNELAAALGDDANFSTTVTNSIATKAPLASPTFTGALTIDDITIDGSTISDGATMTLDAGSQIVLDADGGLIQLKDGGTEFAQLKNSSSDLQIISIVDDKDIIFRGSDNGTYFNALTLDMSDSGTALFNHKVDIATIGQLANVANDLTIYSSASGHNGLRFHANGILPTDNAGAIVDNDADLGDPSYRFKDLYLGGKIYSNANGTGGTKATLADFTSSGSIRSILLKGAENTSNQVFLDVVKDINGTETTLFSIADTNVGIGTTSPQSALHTHIASSGGIYHQFTNSGTGSGASDGWKVGIHDDENFIIWGQESTEWFRVYNNGAYRFEIDNNGAVAIPNNPLYVSTEGTSLNNSGTQNGNYINNNGQSFSSRSADNNQTHKTFYNPNGAVGSIKTNGSATSFNTSSDYRLKENVVTDWDATTLLKQLKPSKFNFKADADTTLQGFLAHEVSSIVPQAVSGEKDAIYTAEEAEDDIDAVEGQPKYQQIDHSKLVPLLVKTIQELEARIKTLEDA